MSVRNWFRIPACFVAAALSIGGAVAAEFPERPITMLIPYTPGGATDGMFRALAHVARKYFPQPIVVENRPGGSGAVAIASMLAQKPDGYIVSVIVPVVQRASYQSKFSFDVVNDLRPVIQVGDCNTASSCAPTRPTGR